VQSRVDLAVVIARPRQVQGFVTDSVCDGGQIAALEADVDHAGVAVAEVADRRHAQLAARAAPRRW
jgi:hypothetical protein